MAMLAASCSNEQQSKAPTGNEAIDLNTVLQPVNASVITSVNAVTPVQAAVADSIVADGYLDFDTRTFNNIAARFSGRIEKLYIKYAFEDIHQGQRIFDIYSPDMVSAQQDMLFLIKNSPQETGLIAAAKQKLLLLGMTTAQLNQVIQSGHPFYSLPVYSPYNGHVHDVAHTQMQGEPVSTLAANYTTNLPLEVKEGMYVQKGQTVFNVVDPHHLWAIIKVKGADATALKTGQPVMISLTDDPARILTGKVDFIEPFLQSGDKSTTIRVYLHNMDHALKVNSLVKATIQTGMINGLWIPRSALTDLGQNQVVWLKSGSVYKAHPVTAGIINNNRIQVVKGLSLTDTVAQNAQYLTDSEGFIKINSNEN